MRRQREDGYCGAFSKSGGSMYVLPREEYPSLLEAWQAGRAFWTGEGYYGGTVTLKLGDIVCVGDTPPEAIYARLHDTREDDREDALHG